MSQKICVMYPKRKRIAYTPNNEKIKVNSAEYLQYITDGFVHHQNKLKKGMICSVTGKFMKEGSKPFVVVSGTKQVIREGSPKFKALRCNYAYNPIEKVMSKYSETLNDGCTYDPITGVQIKLGEKRYKDLHGMGYFYDREKNRFSEGRKYTGKYKKDDFVLNPKTNRFVKVNSNSFMKLKNDNGVMFKEKHNAFVPLFENMLVKQIGAGKFKSLEKRFVLRLKETVADLESFEKGISTKLEILMKNALEEIGSYKVVFVINMTLIKHGFHKVNPYSVAVPYTITTSKDEDAILILHHSDIGNTISTSFEKAKNYLEQAANRGSGWELQSVNKMWLHVFKFSPLSGSSYIELPDAIKAKKACVNVMNKDNRCFEYAVLCALHYEEIKKNHSRISKFENYAGELNFDGIDFPVSYKHYDKFENQNEIKLNVFVLLESEIEPLYISRMAFEKEVDLLLISDEENLNQHYVCIRKFNTLFHDINKNSNAKYFCKNCLQHFHQKELVQKHIDQGKCFTHEPAKINLPKAENGLNYIRFKNVAHQLESPLVIYCDFECSLLQVDEKMGQKTQLFQRHEPNSVGVYVSSKYERFQKGYCQFNGKNCAKQMLMYLKQIENEVLDSIKNSIPLTMSKDDKIAFAQAKDCHICGKKFKKENKAIDDDTKYMEGKKVKEIKSGTKVRDHDHFTGKFRGAAHNWCNLQYSLRHIKIPVVFHNLKGYDSHLLMNAVGSVSENISVIANNFEKYMSFTIDNLRFIDSMQFMPSALSDLAKNIKEFKHVRNGFPNLREEQLQLLTKKGVYPYDYVDNENKFSETSLPPKEAFKSKLNDSEISDVDYNHALNVWNVLGCKTFKDYHDLYLKTDVLLLADVFDNFRETCYKHYGLDAAHYLTAPGLSWDAMLKKTRVQVELFSEGNIDMLLFVEKGMRGGVSVITHRHATANNPYMKSYNEKLDTSYLMYLDANNLYGWAMSQPLPHQNYKWVNPDDFNKENIMSIGENDATGYLFEVDLKYPSELHDLHNDYPFCPEQKISEPSKLMRELKKSLDLKPAKVPKLTQNLNDKKSYVLHYRNLQQAINNGLVLEKVHRVLSFEQSEWLKEYIDFNTLQRAKAVNDFEKDFFKLMNNSIFGKTCENLRNRVDIRLVTNESSLKKLQNKPNFKDSRIICDDLRAVEMRKTQILYNRPIIVGMCVLDISKVLMYDFHYNVIKNRYNTDAKLLFTDTDSLCYQIKTP